MAPPVSTSLCPHDQCGRRLDRSQKKVPTGKKGEVKKNLESLDPDKRGHF